MDVALGGRIGVVGAGVGVLGDVAAGVGVVVIYFQNYVRVKVNTPRSVN